MPADLAASLHALGPAGPTAVVLVVVACGLVCLPVGVLLVAGGLLYGWPLGAAVAVVAALGVALANFAVARGIGAVPLVARLKRRPAIARLGRTLDRDGGLVLGLLRLSPLVSWPALSYAAGLSPIRVRSYLASCVGMMPLALAYAWVGATARDLATHPEAVLDQMRTWAAPSGVALFVLALAVALRPRPGQDLEATPT